MSHLESDEKRRQFLTANSIKKKFFASLPSTPAPSSFQMKINFATGAIIVVEIYELPSLHHRAVSDDTKIAS
jgi:hypothetical protein